MNKIFTKGLKILSALCRKKKNKTPFFAHRPQEVPILFEHEGNLISWGKKEFEKEMEVEYLSGLEFLNEKVYEKIVKKCQKAKKIKEIGQKEMWNGSLFEKEISSGKAGDSFLRWTGAKRGYGLFATRDLPKGYYVGEYTGVVRPFSRWKDRKNCYCFEYKTNPHNKTSYTIDAQDKGNLIRFINHSAHPNITPQLAYCNEIMHLIFITNQSIAKGAEFTYDYGPTYWSKRENPCEGEKP